MKSQIGNTNNITNHTPETIKNIVLVISNSFFIAFLSKFIQHEIFINHFKFVWRSFFRIWTDEYKSKSQNYQVGRQTRGKK